MVGSRPLQPRAEKSMPLNARQKYQLLQAMGVNAPPPASRGGQQRLDQCEVTPVPLQITRVPQAPARSIASMRSGARPPLSPAGFQSSSDLIGSTKAFARGAADSLPFGLADRGFAVVHALGDASSGRNFLASYDRRLKAEDAQDRYDEAMHPTARLGGEITGNVAQTLIPMLGPARMARIAEATPALLFKETGKLMGFGGLSNAALEGVIDGVNGEVSPAKILGAGIGGAAGTFLALKGRPGAAASATGAATSFAQDLLSGNVNSGSLLRALNAAAAGSVAAGVTGRLGARTANGLSIRTKGRLGEALSKGRTWVRGDRVANTHEPIDLTQGYTVADHITRGRQAVEAKFGRYAKLSKRQRQAVDELDDYRVDHFLPRDVGAMIELPLGMFTYQANDAMDRRTR